MGAARQLPTFTPTTCLCGFSYAYLYPTWCPFGAFGGGTGITSLIIELKLAVRILDQGGPIGGNQLPLYHARRFGRMPLVLRQRTRFGLPMLLTVLPQTLHLSTKTAVIPACPRKGCVLGSPGKKVLERVPIVSSRDRGWGRQSLLI